MTKNVTCPACEFNDEFTKEQKEEFQCFICGKWRK